ncbi:MAG: type III polyketide synthase [Alphaproteobacteria bacterium]|nr:type III polyketide synthase [Alphaproteobacteria bacterium]
MANSSKVMQARIFAVATAVPEFVLRQTDVVARAAEIFAPDVPDFDRFAPVYANAGVATRYSCVPIEWYGQPHTFSERNDLYIENAVRLLERVVGALLDQSKLTAGDIDALVVVSTTGMATPSLDALLIERMAFRRDVERLPVFGLGCAGGVSGLARAAQLALSRPGARVMLLVVELCGLTFQANDTSKSNIISTALFGDGAAGALVQCGDPGAITGPAIVDWAEHTWPNSLDIMGWSIGEDGLGVLLSRDIPGFVRENLPAPATAFLERNGLTAADIDCHICHPGGAKVLDALEDVFGLAPGALVASRAVMRDYGNMSAATALFVLERTMSEAPAGRLLMSALGPGFTASFALLDAA